MSPYGASKAVNEIQAGSAARVWGLDCVGFSSSTSTAEADPWLYASVIPRFCHALSSGGRPVIFGDGSQTRDFVYVRDLTSVLLKMCDRAQQNRGRVFNLATGKSMTVNELLKLISEIMGSDVKEERLPERPGDIKISSADISLLTEALGRREFTDIRCAISKTAEWYRDHSKK